MPTIHWLGAGLSSAPGIRALVASKYPLVVWNRTLAKAAEIVAHCDPATPARKFDMHTLARTIESGDVLVSMLPADIHHEVAQLALDKGAHFVSSSYISPDMRALNERAGQAGLCLVNEVGLDPGLDHLMAHLLVEQYRLSEQFSAHNTLEFRSYCGGFPAVPNDFRYKFSWSPVGVLRALKTPAKCIENSQVIDTERPWEKISNYKAQLPHGTETFQAYPNRDSLPFMQDYGFDADWSVKEFVRGTLRLPGWSDAWADLFCELDTLSGEAGEQRLQEMSAELWRTQSYKQGEKDRVVLCVELEVSANDAVIWHRGYSLDSTGNEEGSAMARLVSNTVALAVESILDGHIKPGVSAAPSDASLIKDWFAQLSEKGDAVHAIDYLK